MHLSAIQTHMQTEGKTRKTEFCNINHISLGSVEMFKNLERSWEFHRRRFGPPKIAINPEQVIRHHRSKRKGDKEEQALSPP